MLTFLTKDANIEAIKIDILAALSRRNFEAEGLRSRLSWKMYHIEMALYELLREGRVVSFWTDSGRSQRQFYALTENFDPAQPVMQICASAEALEKLGQIKLTSRQEIQQAQAKREDEPAANH
jgi:hypothetical protein